MTGNKSLACIGKYHKFSSFSFRNEAFSRNGCSTFPGLNYKANNTFLNSLTKNFFEFQVLNLRQLKVMERARLTVCSWMYLNFSEFWRVRCASIVGRERDYRIWKVRVQPWVAIFILFNRKWKRPFTKGTLAASTNNPTSFPGSLFLPLPRGIGKKRNLGPRLKTAFMVKNAFHFCFSSVRLIINLFDTNQMSSYQSMSFVLFWLFACLFVCFFEGEGKDLYILILRCNIQRPCISSR